MEGNVKVSDQTNDGSTDDGINEKKVEAVQNPADDYRRDMFKFKSEAKSLRDELDEYKLKEQEQAGNLQEVIAKLKGENRQLKQSVAKSEVSFAEGKIEDAIKTVASKLGCTDPETFYRLVERSDIDIIELDDKFRANKEDINSIVDKYRKNYEHLGFFNKKVNIVDGVPNSKPNNKPVKQKALSDMSQEELMSLAADTGLKRINR